MGERQRVRQPQPRPSSGATPLSSPPANQATPTHDGRAHVARLGAPFPKQLEFLKSPRLELGADGKPTIRRINYVGGRGSAKTTAGIFDMAITADRMPSLITAWREPRWSDIERVLLTALREAIPEAWGYWRMVRIDGHRYIKWRNGHMTHLLARQVDDPGKRVALGSNYAGVWEDEAADKFGRDKFVDIQNAIRDRRAPYLFHVTLSTPVIGEYEAWCRVAGATTIHASSYDNPYIAQGVIDAWRASMSPEQWRQEVLGEFVPQAGRVWTSWHEAPWPVGNIIEGYDFDPSRPWYLSCDLGGAQSAYQIWQYVDPARVCSRAPRMSGRIACLVAEYTPNHIGLGAVLDDIINTYGGGWTEGGVPRKPPARAYVGSDVSSPSNAGVTGAQMLYEMGIDFSSPRGDLARKDAQRSAAMTAILTSDGVRRFAVAAKRGADGRYYTRQHYGEGKSRGILQVMRSDTYPPVSSRELFWKDKPTRGINALEDDRDAFLYFVVSEFPPVWGVGGVRAVESVN